VLFSEPKIPQSFRRTRPTEQERRVSVLFSEPKIPQCGAERAAIRTFRTGFSALQRAENSSIHRNNDAQALPSIVSVLFSEPKIPQFIQHFDHRVKVVSFSALQRAENSSISNEAAVIGVDWGVSVLFSEPKIPQCLCSRRSTRVWKVSVLFSEPKIPQSGFVSSRYVAVFRFQCSSASRKFLNNSLCQKFRRNAIVSVLFSEPKIPQLTAPPPSTSTVNVFQCSSASRKFLNARRGDRPASGVVKFQCSSASRKFLNRSADQRASRCWTVSVLFSEPKIPQFLITVSR